MNSSNSSATFNKDEFREGLYRTMISGGIAGSLGKTLSAPLSRITILFQVLFFLS